VAVQAFQLDVVPVLWGDIREGAVRSLREKVERLAALPPVDEDRDQPRGLFMVTDESGEARWWRVRGGGVLDVPAPGFEWLVWVSGG